MAKISLNKIQPILEAIDSGDDLSQWEVKLSDETIKRASNPIERMLSLSF
jgi:quinolinate synthase